MTFAQTLIATLAIIAVLACFAVFLGIRDINRRDGKDRVRPDDF